MKLYQRLPAPRERNQYNLVEGRGVEWEVGEFLYGLVRLVKPVVCIETGTYVGDSAVNIARALRDNGKGHLYTCDINVLDEAVERLRDLPATIRRCRGIDLLSVFPPGIDFVHIDSGDPETRQWELMALDEMNISPGGIVCWHDACKDYQNLYESFAPERNWPHLVFPSVVGFAVFQRPE